MAILCDKCISTDVIGTVDGIPYCARHYYGSIRSEDNDYGDEDLGCPVPKREPKLMPALPPAVPRHNAEMAKANANPKVMQCSYCGKASDAFIKGFARGYRKNSQLSNDSIRLVICAGCIDNHKKLIQDKYVKSEAERDDSNDQWSNACDES